MSNNNKAIVSVYDRTDLIEFLEGLASQDWQLYATFGTRKTYRAVTGSDIKATSDLVAPDNESDSENRDRTAFLVSELMTRTGCIGLACLNLRPPRLEAADSPTRQTISLDVGGMAMIAAAGTSGALVVTDPNDYDEVLTSLSTTNGTDSALQRRLQLSSIDHVVQHMSEAISLGSLPR